MKVLLVEPDILLAKTYRKALEQAGHQVQTSFTAQDAIHAADSDTPELVILEMQLVSHSGVEFLYEFRSYPEWQHVPVVALSVVPPGEFQGSRQLLRGHLGVERYLYKPHTTLAKLLRTVSDFAAVEA